MTEPRQLGEWREYDDLIDLMKARLGELNMPYSLFEKLAGWPSGMAGKVFGEARIKRIGPVHLGPAFEVLAMRAIIVEDIDAAKRMEARWEEKRNPASYNAERSAYVGKRTIKRMFPVIIREIAKRGVEGRMVKMKPATRRRVARQAARARWAKVKAVKKGAKAQIAPTPQVIP